MSARFTAELARVTDKLDRATEEIEALNRLHAVRFVNREETARIVDVSKRTIQRYEEEGLIDRIPTQSGKVLYKYTDAVKLKRMVK